MRNRRRLLPLCFTLVLVLTIGIGSFKVLRTGAVSGADFKAGNIIDDYTFYNSGSMSAAQIQTFLNSKVSSCDTNGTLQKSYYYSSSTGKVSGSSFSGGSYVTTSRALYGSRYNVYNNTADAATPFVCLKDYKQNTPAMSAESGICGNLTAKSNRTAAQIITDAAAACGINPQVLVVLLQKEQGLVTDSWPWKNQYEKATGFSCPDTAPCNPAYGGFFYQVYYAARQFKLYRANPDNYNYVARQNNYIYYNPDHSCGGSWVYIENQATAGLYDYTPYQPNAATLKVSLGQTAACGAYGNKNFWWYFTDWFGSTHAAQVSFTPIKFENQPFTDAQTTASFTITNVSNKTINLGTFLIAGRDSANGHHDFPAVNVSLAAGKTYTYRQKVTLDGPEDTYRFFIARKNTAGTWQTPAFNDLYQLEESDISRVVTKQPTLTSPLTITPSTLHAGQNATASFKIRNNSSQPLNIGSVGAAVRDGSGAIYDFPFVTSLTLSAGQEYTYSQTRSLPDTGQYRVYVLSHRTSYGWDSTYPASSDSSFSREVNLNVNDSVTLTSPLTITPSTLHAGQNATASFQVRNHSDNPINLGYLGAAVRDSSGKIYDFPFASNLTLAAGQTYTYSQTRTLPHTGQYRIYVLNQRPGQAWSSTYPGNETASLVREIRPTVKDSVTLTSALSVTQSSTSLHVGSTTTATFKIKNYSNSPINVGTIGVAVRDNKGKAYDFPFVTSLTLSAGQEYTYSQTKTFASAGAYRMFITDNRPVVGWDKSYPENETPSFTREVSPVIKDQATLTSSLSLDPTAVHVKQSVTANFTVTNNGDNPINLGYLGAAVRDSSGKIYDFPFASNLTLAAGQTYTYSQTRTLPHTGQYRIYVLNQRPGQAWSSTYPGNETASLVREIRPTVKDSVTLTSALSVTMPNAKVGQNATANFAVTNFSSSPINIGTIGIAGRSADGKIYDFPFASNLTLAAGQTYTYSQTRTFPSASTYRLFLTDYRTSYGWQKAYPASESASFVRELKIKVSN